MEIRYPYWAHIAVVVSRPRRKHIWRSAWPCRPVGALQHWLLGLLRWTCPRFLVGAGQYGLPGWWRWTCPPGRRSGVRTTFFCVVLDLLSRPCSTSTQRPLSTLQSLANWPAASGGGGTGAATTIICSSCLSGLAAAPVPCMGMATDAGWAAWQGLLPSLPLAPYPPIPTPPPLNSHASCSPSCLPTRGQAMLCPCPPRTI